MAILSGMTIADLFQQPPVTGKLIFFQFSNTDSAETLLLGLQLWNLIKYAELKEVVRQNDKLFIGLLNNVPVGNVDDHVENLLIARFICEPDRNFSKDALHMYGENKTAMRKNESVLNELSGKRYTIEANEKTLDNCKYPLTLMQHAQNPKQ